ncbi:MAG TPA: hypothetical protein VGM64_17780 [Lacunisphaera sp.]|jgi:hypothetical protein
MKIPTTLLALSVAINLTLLVVLFIPRDAENEMINSISAQKKSSLDGSASTSGTRGSKEKESQPHVSGLGLQWSQIDTTDLPELVRRLRAMGFPPALVNRLIEMRLQDLFAARREAIMGRKTETDYWKSLYAAPATQKQREALSALNFEQYDLKRKLLGRAYEGADESYTDYLTVQYGELSQQKLAIIAGITSDYTELRMETVRAFHAAGKNPTQEDWAKFRLIDEQMRAEIASTLTPDESQAMELRSSLAANRLRADTQLFRTTEAEFNSLFPLYKSLVAATSTTTDQSAYRAAQQSIQPEIAATLGPARYAEYQQAINPAYDKLNKIVQRLDLPISTAISIASVQQDTIQQADTVRADSTLTADQKRAQIDSLAQASLVKISSSLGPQGFEAYKKYSTQWLRPLGVTVTPKK